MRRVTITLRDSKEINAFLPNEEANQLMDQFYNICSGEFTDNCLEITTKDNQLIESTTLIRADQVLFIQIKDYIDA